MANIEKSTDSTADVKAPAYSMRRSRGLDSYKQLTPKTWRDLVDSMVIGESIPLSFYAGTDVFEAFLKNTGANRRDFLGSKFRHIRVPVSAALKEVIDQRGIYTQGIDAPVAAYRNYNLELVKQVTGAYRLIVRYSTIIGSWPVYELSDEDLAYLQAAYDKLLSA